METIIRFFDQWRTFRNLPVEISSRLIAAAIACRGNIYVSLSPTLKGRQNEISLLVDAMTNSLTDGGLLDGDLRLIWKDGYHEGVPFMAMDQIPPKRSRAADAGVLPG